MSDTPLFAAIVGKELGTSQVEDAEAIEGFLCFNRIDSFGLCVLAQELDRLASFVLQVLPLQPVFASLGVMFSIDPERPKSSVSKASGGELRDDHKDVLTTTSSPAQHAAESAETGRDWAWYRQ